MKYLIKLNRFELDKEKLKNKIISLDSSATFDDEEGYFFVDSKIQGEKFIELQEVARVVCLFTDWGEFGFKTLKEDCLNLVRKINIKSYSIETKFYDKVPISAKSLYKHINPYLKHEGILVDEENGDIIYLELKKFSEGLKYRVGYSKRELWQKSGALNLDFSNFNVVIEEPRLVEEISDFLRLCWIFSLPLFILTKNKDAVDKLVNKAKKITKGIDYDKFTLKYIPYLSKDFIKVGFSKHANQNELDLLKFFDDNSEDRICLVFGNDTYGLSQEVRDDLDYCFRLTPELKKPLKASQALSYILGIYAGYKL